jgi:hypothetical protein
MSLFDLAVAVDSPQGLTPSGWQSRPRAGGRRSVACSRSGCMSRNTRSRPRRMWQTLRSPRLIQAAPAALKIAGVTDRAVSKASVALRPTVPVAGPLVASIDCRRQAA